MYPMRENSRSDPAEPARIEKMYIAKETKLAPISTRVSPKDTRVLTLYTTSINNININ